jgi:hypothetical protein
MVYGSNLWFQLDELLDAERTCFEEPQLAILREQKICSVFQITFRTSLLTSILSCIRSILAQFDGWIGVDDGSFSTRFDLSHLETSPDAIYSFLNSEDCQE